MFVPTEAITATEGLGDDRLRPQVGQHRPERMRDVRAVRVGEAERLLRREIEPGVMAS